ncbi:probable G-protein coupled receptor 139 [Narcine bancroftii]|uniref:probable G-protein coupled receptor 139 n=1 Tax=Narcine bancroftii TaxID=1343680 RepID=UPI003831F6D4
MESPPEVWKAGGKTLHAKLHELFKLGWDQGKLPQDLRDAIIITLYQNNGEKSDCSNYRGITLLFIAALEKEDVMDLEAPFTELEMKTAMMEMPNGKSPGDYRFSVEFYETLYEDLSSVFGEFRLNTFDFPQFLMENHYMVVEDLGSVQCILDEFYENIISGTRDKQFFRKGSKTRSNSKTEVSRLTMDSSRRIPILIQILLTLWDIQMVYYPFLAAFGIPINLVTILILSREKCGLSKCVTFYLVAMATSDLLIIIIDLVLRHIPIIYQLQFVRYIPLCNIHAVLLYAVTDCSVWFTVMFTIDRFVAICSQKLKVKYCTEKTAVMTLATVAVLSLFKNTIWYFVYTGMYWLINDPWFCVVRDGILNSWTWGAIEFLHFVLTPGLPFILILQLNAVTIKHILSASKARRRLRNQGTGEHRKDTEMDNRRKSIVLLFVISGNFIILWAVFMVYTIWRRMRYLGYMSANLPFFVREMGFMLQLLSCCTNTCIYAVTQNKFRKQFMEVFKYPFTLIIKLYK